jgi:hypothetical protein
MEARSSDCPGEAEEAVAALAGQVLSMTPAVKFLTLPSGGTARWAMRECIGDTAGDSLAGGGARRSSPSIPTCLASLVLLCLYITQ